MSAHLAIFLLALMGVAILLWQVASNAAAILIVAGIVALATWATAEQVSLYHQSQQALKGERVAVAAPEPVDQAAFQPPPMPPPAFSPLPLRRGMTGSAAPPAVVPPPPRS